jgi:hypothetical protein
MMRKLLCVALLWLLSTVALFAQTPGLIYKPSSTSFGKSVLDPNSDGFTSLTYAGFTTTDYGTESELQMVGLPVLSNEILSDLSTGPSGGHTDISNNGTAQSVYVLMKTVDNVQYLVIRFRVGGASTAPKGYSLMLDTDNNFNNNYTSDNPGFEREIVLEASKRVRIYSHSASGESILQTYDVNEYQQRSIAKSTGGGNADYFYDFFVPYSALNINSNVRMAAATITSAQSGISGTSSDFQGVDDSAYKGNKRAMMSALINSFPPVALTALVPGYSFPAGITLTPSINSITVQSPAITGTSLEAQGTIITIYKGGVLLGTTTVQSNNTWSYTTSGLQVGDIITATATATDKTVSSLSSSVTVTALVATCYTVPAVISNRANGSQSLTGTWSNGSTITANNVRIRFYYQTGASQVFTEDTSVATPTYVATNGTWTCATLGNGSQTTFAGRSYYVTATVGTATATTADDCTSVYSNGIVGNNNSGTITATPTISPTTILASTGSTNVTVTNTLAAAATLYLYVNGVQVQTANVGASASTVFSYQGFNEGDIVYARAMGTAVGSIMSNLSTQVTVTTVAAQTTAPVLNGPYIQGTQTLTGTSTEAPGTVVTLYVGGVATTNTTTVDIYGNFTFTNIALTTGQVLTVRAKANGKSLSVASNSFTVQAAAPAAPTVTGPLFVPNTATTSISGTGGSGTVTVYVDGTAIGTTTGISWTLSNVDSANLYRGALITATNTSATTGITSAFSTAVTVQGVVSFSITDTNGNAISEKKSGETFDILITAKSSAGGAGAVYTNFTGKLVVSSDAGMLVGGGQTLNFVNGVATHTIALGDPGLGRYIFAINSDDPTATGQRTLDMIEAIWEGSISTDYAVAANWVYNFVPADGATIRFAIPTINDCLLDQNRILGSISNNQTNYKLNLNGHKLQVNGTLIFTNNAKIEATTEGSTLSFTGKSAQQLDSTVLANQTIFGLESAGSATLILNGPLALTGILTLTSGTLDTQNGLTMKSTVTRTAMVAPVTRGTITGTVTVERFIPARRAFRLINSPVNGGSVHDNWQEGAPEGDIPGYGTDITGNGGTTNGFDTSGSNNPSLFTFDNVAQVWAPVTNTNTTNLVAGTPYRMLIRGDRTINQASNMATPNNTTLRATGNLVTGPVTVTTLSQTAGGWNLVGNPYQAPVDMSAVVTASTNINQNFYYVWDPTQGGAPVAGQTTGGRGSYIAIALPDGINTGGSVANKYLQPNQAFFIETLANGPASITFNESYKGMTTGTPTLYRNGGDTPRIKMQLFDSYSLALGNTSSDGLIIDFDPEHANEVDVMDAIKFTNQDENFAISNGEALLSIERREMPLLTDVIALYNAQYRKTNYTYSVKVQELTTVTAYLLDKYTNEVTELVNNSETFYNFTVNPEDTESIAANRFEIIFGEVALGNSQFNLSNEVKLYPNPAQDSQFSVQVQNAAEASVTVYNALGQKVACTSTVQSGNTVLVKGQSPMASGIYTVQVTADGKSTTKKLIIK